MGGLEEVDARLHRPRSVDELAGLLASLSNVVLVGGQQSFGGHFLPAAGGEAVSVAELPQRIEKLGGGWVRASGSVTLAELVDAVPDHLPRNPPTTDLATIGGAIAGCTHDSVGYFCSNVRWFRFLAADGTVHECHPAATGLAERLYRHVPGSFGALGVVLDAELQLVPTAPDECVEIAITHRGRHPDPVAVAKLREVGLGGAIYLYGTTQTAVVDARIARAANVVDLPRMPLTDDAWGRNAYLQGIANRFPWLVAAIATRTLPEGKRFRAPRYSHAFFQKSYARAFGILSGDALTARALGALGVDPRLPVVHQSFAIPEGKAGDFYRVYVSVLETYRDLLPRIEAQDMIALPACPFPLHGMHGMGAAYLFTSSLSVPRGSRLEAHARAFLAEVAAKTWRDHGAKTLLLKQAHVPDALLRDQHSDAIARLRALKAEVDPRGVLSSRLLARLKL